MYIILQITSFILHTTYHMLHTGVVHTYKPTQSNVHTHRHTLCICMLMIHTIRCFYCKNYKVQGYLNGVGCTITTPSLPTLCCIHVYVQLHTRTHTYFIMKGTSFEFNIWWLHAFHGDHIIGLAPRVNCGQVGVTMATALIPQWHPLLSCIWNNAGSHDVLSFVLHMHTHTRTHKDTDTHTDTLTIITISWWGIINQH